MVRQYDEATQLSTTTDMMCPNRIYNHEKIHSIDGNKLIEYITITLVYTAVLLTARHVLCNIYYAFFTKSSRSRLKCNFS